MSLKRALIYFSIDVYSYFKVWLKKLQKLPVLNDLITVESVFHSEIGRKRKIFMTHVRKKAASFREAALKKRDTRQL